MKKILRIACAAIFLIITLTGISPIFLRTLLIVGADLPGFILPAEAAEQKVVVGVSPFPHKDIMEIAKKLLEPKGYSLTILEFNDYVQPNLALADGDIDANFFQHIPYLDHMNEELNLDLAWVVKVHVEPLGLYSKEIISLFDLPIGAFLGIPNDPANGSRALRLLESRGLITLNSEELVSVRDITDNPYNIQILELDASMLPHALHDVAAAIINTNFAGEAGLIPSRDAIIMESKNIPYANVLVVRNADKDSPAVHALAEALNSQEVRDFIVNELEPKGILPAF